MNEHKCSLNYKTYGQTVIHIIITPRLQDKLIYEQPHFQERKTALLLS